MDENYISKSVAVGKRDFAYKTYSNYYFDKDYKGATYVPFYVALEMHKVTKNNLLVTVTIDESYDLYLFPSFSSSVINLISPFYPFFSGQMTNLILMSRPRNVGHPYFILAKICLSMVPDFWQFLNS